MNLILKTIGISLVLTIAGCANTGTNNTASLGAADDTPACCGSAACSGQEDCMWHRLHKAMLRQQGQPRRSRRCPLLCFIMQHSLQGQM